MNYNVFKNLELAKTGDGSSSFYLPDLDEHYHSKHGALRESKHVFIDKGLDYFHQKFPKNTPIRILELGFGTGLNALLSLEYALNHSTPIHYQSLDAFPIPKHKIDQLNYRDILKSNQDLAPHFEELHRVSWEEKHRLTPDFSLLKSQMFFQDFTEKNRYDLIYYDAFGSRVQPELWTEALIAQIGKALKKPGVMVTYAAKGNFKRASQSLGFNLEKLNGPPGKREMMRATNE